MEINKLTKSQIDQLFTFTRQHYVEWYDLQSELVDHLANAIESQWQENPELTFDVVLKNEFWKFGVYGFMDVVEERQKFLSKKYTRLIWKYYKEFFRLPKIILTIALVYGIYTLIHLIQNPNKILPIITAVLLIVSFLFTLKKRLDFKQKAKTTGKKWLFEEIMINRVSLLLFFLPSTVINFFNTFHDNIKHTELSLILGTISFVLVSLLVFIQLKIIPKKVSEELEKTYPEYKLEKA